MFFTPRPLAYAVAIVCACSAFPLSATESSEYEEITVTATRSERDINEIAANVTVITSEQVDALSAQNIKDIFRFEPGVAVEGSGRFGLSDINIRGINGDRVLILLDGIPVADEFSFGPNLSSRRDFIDVDLIQSAEVIRGPVSTLYGSDAIGGVVAFTSKDPIDLIDVGESFAGRVKLGYASQSSETNINAQLAGVNGDWQWLLNADYRDGSEVNNHSETANPQDNRNENALLKLLWTPTEEHRLTLVGESFSSDAETILNSDIGAAIFGFMTVSSTGDDAQERDRISLHYSYQPQNEWFYRFTVDAFTQSSDTAQHSEITRLSLADISQGFLRTRDSFFEQDTSGVLSQMDFRFQGGGEHYLIAGFEWQKTDSESLREGESRDMNNGELMQEFSVFPARDFPISSLTEFALFVQDEIQFLEGALTISPGLRYDSFELEAENDPVFAAANPGVAISDFDDSQLSAKIGAVYELGQDSSVWLQWAQGFRIPPMDDLNIGFTNFAGGYTSLPNPELKPERVDSIELGWRHSLEDLSFSISAYHNDYEDFIESRSVAGFNRQTNLVEFQARNVQNVEIQGVDVGLTYQLDDWQMRLASSWQQSEDVATGEELESVLPAQTVVGLQYGDLDSDWRIEFVGTYTERANSFAAEDGEPDNFTAPSATVFDVLAHYQVTEDLRMNFGLFNLTDKEYWPASETVGRTVEDNLDLLTATGRNFSANLVYTF